MNSGFVAALGAFFAWGLFPLYWKQLDAVPALEIMLHRLLWCCVFAVTYLSLRQGSRWWRPLLRRPKLLALLTVTSALIGGNWLLYIWAVTSGHIVETSLGYFINPLVNVLLGVAVLRERLNPARWLAVALAATGVAWMTWQFGRLPWIALALAVSFAAYGLLRKIAIVDAIPGLAVESMLLAPIAIVYLGGQEIAGSGAFGAAPAATQALLVIGGLVTALPLIWFAYGAKRLPLSTIGLLQYLAPCLQLMIGVLVYHEPFGTDRLIGFISIWVALLIYAGDSLLRYRRDLVASRPIPVAVDARNP